MRLPGAVRVHCRSGVAWRLVQAALSAIAGFGLCLWGLLWLRQDPAAAWAASAAVAMACAVIVFRRVQSPEAWLVWDGTAWSCASGSDADPVLLDAVDVMIDLETGLLLRAKPAVGSPRWLIARRSDAGGEFGALCAALYAQHAPARSPSTTSSSEAAAPPPSQPR